MISEELKKYIRESLVIGKTAEDISRALLGTGWQESDISGAFQELRVMSEQQIKTVKRKTTRPFIYSAFIFVVILLIGAILYLWQDRFDLSNTNAQKVRDFYTRLAQSHIFFADTGEMVFPEEQKFITQKSEYIQNQKSFVEADLRTM